MTCFHPIKVWKQTKADLFIPPQDYYELKKVTFKPVPDRIKIEIPCNNCLGCKLDHASMWSTRLQMEAKQWKNCCVIALTYNNPNLKTNEKSGLNTLYKKDLQDFLKRLRYYHKGIEKWTIKQKRYDKEAFIEILEDVEEYPIRYFACGEYGMTGSRAKNGGNPHYHICLFNYIPNDLEFYKYNKYGDIVYKSKDLMKIWGKGFVTVEDFNENTANYVARYVQKKAGIEPHHREYTGELTGEYKIDERNGNTFIHFKETVKKEDYPQEQEFLTMSRKIGLGRKYWDKNKEKIKRNGGILFKEKDHIHKKPIPRYFCKLWEEENYEEYWRFKFVKTKEGIKKKAEIIAQIKLPDGTTDEEKYTFYLKQQEIKLADIARKKLQRNQTLDDNC